VAGLSAPKQNGPPKGGPFFVELRGQITGSEPVRAPEPVRAQVREPAQVPERAQALAQELARQASSVRPEPERVPACWRPAAQLAPGLRCVCRKHSRRQWPG